MKLSRILGWNLKRSCIHDNATNSKRKRLDTHLILSKYVYMSLCI